MSWQNAFLPAENTQLSARSTEISRQIERMSWQNAFLPAENTKMSGRSQPMRRQTEQMRTAIGKMSPQIVNCVRRLK
jgi:alpha-acetolactate decarboxylase